MSGAGEKSLGSLEDTKTQHGPWAELATAWGAEPGLDGCSPKATRLLSCLLPDPGLPRGPHILFSTVSFTLGQTQRPSTRAMPELQVPVGGGAEVIEVPGVSSPALLNVLGNPSIPFLQSVSEQAVLL